MLIASDVWFGYNADRPALKGVNVAVAPDAVVGILGPNGSGKTTLLRVLAGTRHPQRGSVLLDGAPLAHTPRALLSRRLAVVPQETQLAFDYTVAEVAMMGRYPHLGAFEIEGPRDIAIVEAALASTGTRHLQDRLFATLSGGEKQRVVIASALAQIGAREAGENRDGGNGTGVTNGGTEQRSSTETMGLRSSPFPRASVCDARPVPSVPSVPVPSVPVLSGPALSGLSRYLLLDEPTASLDLAYQLEVGGLVRDIHRQGRAGIVISTHDIGLAGTLCDSLVLLREGVVVASGATADVLTKENLARVYGVETDIVRHASGQFVVVPIRRLAEGPQP